MAFTRLADHIPSSPVGVSGPQSQEVEVNKKYWYSAGYLDAVLKAEDALLENEREVICYSTCTSALTDADKDVIDHAVSFSNADSPKKKWALLPVNHTVNHEGVLWGMLVV